MKVTIYNDKYSFSETLEFEYEDDFEYWNSAPEIDCEVGEVKNGHPCYGWMECYSQSDYVLDIIWTHIKFEKN